MWLHGFFLVNKEESLVEEFNKKKYSVLLYIHPLSPPCVTWFRRTFGECLRLNFDTLDVCVRGTNMLVSKTLKFALPQKVEYRSLLVPNTKCSRSACCLCSFHYFPTRTQFAVEYGLNFLQCTLPCWAVVEEGLTTTVGSPDVCLCHPYRMSGSNLTLRVIDPTPSLPVRGEVFGAIYGRHRDTTRGEIHLIHG